MKIGILTFHNVPNYGAILQAFALSKTIENLGHSVNIINYKCKGNDEQFSPAIAEYNPLHATPKNYIKNTMRWFRYKLLIESEYKCKYDLFQKFSKQFIKVSDPISDVNLLSVEYDAVVCGSDQIWNPDITGKYDDFYYAKGLENFNAISYAASTGDVSTVINYNENDFFERLKNFKHLSVREKQLSKYINQVGKIKCDVVLDPSMLLCSNDYEEIIPSDYDVPQKYVLVYQLARYDKVYEIANKVAKERNLQVIELCGVPYPALHNSNIICNAGPREFLKLIKNANYVVTNSFHGAAFSIIYKKDFSCVQSRTRSSRLVNLLDGFNIQSRLVTETDFEYDISEINYDNLNILLRQKKEESISFLTTALGEEFE